MRYCSAAHYERSNHAEVRVGLEFRRLATATGALALAFGALSATAGPAGAVPASSVNWSCFNNPSTAGCPAASFNGYADGAELYLTALPGITTQVADLYQGFSGASTASAGLTKVINSEDGANVQPAEAATVKSYATGSGIELGVNTATIPTSDVNQVQVAGHFSVTAPPDTTPAAKTVGPVALPPVANATLLTGDGSAVYNNAVCPIGQPLSYGFGDAAGVQALYTGTTPVLSTAGTGTSVAQSTSQTYLTSNGDGSFGISTQANDIIAPVTATLPGGVALSIAVQSAGGVDDPVSLTAHTTGEATGATLKVSSDDIIVIKLGNTVLLSIPLSQILPGGLHIPLNTQAVGAIQTVAGNLPAVGPILQNVLGTNSALGGVLSTVATTVGQVTGGALVSLGSIDIDTTPHPIGQAATVTATPTGGTAASGAIDLIHVHLGLSSSTVTTLPAIADFEVGHLEAAATQTAPITCTLPVIKTSSAETVQAPGTFTYNIEVPDPAYLGLIDCDLDNVTVTDVIKDKTGTPSFQVTGAVDSATNQAGTITQTDPHNATITWTGLSYKVATSGPPNAPIPLAITVSVPANTTVGQITDTVSAVAMTANCRGGASASTAAAAGGNGATLTGDYSLDEPGVTLTPAAAANPAATTPAKTLPYTGAMGGLWQPVGGLAALGLGAAGLGLARRARRAGS